MRCGWTLPGSRRSSLKVVGNLPYNISTPLLFHLLQFDRINLMVFMLQKEVVDRLCARADTPEYGRLSVMVQARCRTERLFEVGPDAFRPRPKVDSAMVRLSVMPGATDPDTGISTSLRTWCAPPSPPAARRSATV